MCDIVRTERYVAITERDMMDVKRDTKDVSSHNEKWQRDINYPLRYIMRAIRDVHQLLSYVNA